MTEHTPGPWMWVRDHEPGCVPCHTLRGPTVLCRWWETIVDPANGRPADARLIAAAPAMLAALKAAVELADGRLETHFHGRTPECQEVYDQCVAAIAKASPHRGGKET